MLSRRFRYNWQNLCICILLGGDHLEYLSVLHVLHLLYQLLFSTLLCALGSNLCEPRQLSPCLLVSSCLASVRDISRRPGRATPPSRWILDILSRSQPLFNGSFFYSATEIFLGSSFIFSLNNPSLAFLDIEMIMTFWCCHLKIYHCPLMLISNSAYTFENGSFITFSWIYQLVCFFLPGLYW